MVLELESLSAPLKVAFEFSKFRPVGMIGQVALKFSQVRELFGAHRT